MRTGLTPSPQFLSRFRLRVENRSPRKANVSRRHTVLNFLLLMLIPFLIAVGVLIAFKGKVTWWEFLGQIGVVALVVGIAIGCAYEGRTRDTEVWNGQVTGKKRNEVSCRHSYRCHCHEVCSGSGKNESCSEECDTCYEHSY